MMPAAKRQATLHAVRQVGSTLGMTLCMSEERARWFTAHGLKISACGLSLLL